MKKIFLITFLALLFLSLIPAQTQAGIVPCGLSEDDPDQPGDQTVPCQFCHFFVMLDRIIDFVLLNIVPLLATLVLVIGGIMLFTAGGSPETLNRAKSLISAAVFGLLIIYSAWLIIGLFLQAIGLADWTKEIYKNWWEEGFFQFPCP